MNSNSNHFPTTRELLQPSNYHSHHIIDEIKIIPLLSFIHTRDTYFHQK